jgi:hypothetical protein
LKFLFASFFVQLRSFSNMNFVANICLHNLLLAVELSKKYISLSEFLIGFLHSLNQKCSLQFLKIPKSYFLMKKLFDYSRSKSR